jgi:AhpC/TSA family/Disulphide bond corrector protein DsbC
LEQNVERIHSQGLGLAAISYDSVGVLKQFANRVHITFPLLSDHDSAVIREYGILNATVPKDSFAFGIPYPGTYVLNARGVVEAKYFEDDYKVRDTAASILLRQFGLTPRPAESVAAKHATLRTSGGEEEYRPGQRLTLSVDVALPHKVHVYAPGVEDTYRPVAFRLADAKGYQADAPAYPAAKRVTLPAIHERVPVYEGQFRVLDTITLANAQQIEPLLDSNRQLTIEGAFEYQACDDRQCFLPETVPLRWTVKVQPFDRTRVTPDLQRKGGGQ